MKQVMMRWQWHHLDHMQIICTLLQTDNQASTSSLNFLQAGCFSRRPTNSVNALYSLQTSKDIYCRHDNYTFVVLVVVVTILCQPVTNSINKATSFHNIMNTIYTVNIQKMLHKVNNTQSYVSILDLGKRSTVQLMISKLIIQNWFTKKISGRFKFNCQI